MAIDARIEAIRHKPDKHILFLVPSGPGAIAGRRKLYITRNPDYVPHTGDLIWGNSRQCMIGPHEFRRIQRFFDGTEEAL